MIIISLIKSFNNSYLKRGISESRPEKINRKLWISNVFAFCFGLTVPAYIPFFYREGMYTLSYGLILLTVFYVIVPLVNGFGFINFSRISMIVMTHFYVGWYTIVMDITSGIHLWFILAILYPIIFFDHTERKQFLTCIVVSITSISTAVLYSIYDNKQYYQLSSETNLLLSSIFFFGVIFAILLIVSLYYYGNRIYEKNIYDTNLRLRESEEKYRLLFENMTSGFALHEMIYDDSGNAIDYRFLEINPAFEKLTGAPVDALLGKTVLEVMPNTEKHWIETYGKVASTGIPTSYENYAQELGKYYDTYSFSPRKGLFAVVFNDITKRKKVEKDLLLLQNYLSNIINSMPSVLIGVNPNGEVDQWNNEAYKVTGITAEEAKGKSLDQTFPRLSTEIQRVQIAVETRITQKNSKRPYKHNGEICFEDITIYPLITNGVDGAVIRIDNVTEQVHIQEMLIQNEKMLSVGGLAAGMAHEINNPLAGMMQSAGVLLKRLVNSTDIPANQKAALQAGTSMEVIKDFMEIRNIPRIINSIVDSGRRVADIVGNMLNFVRKEDKQISSHDINELLDNTLDLAVTDYSLKKHFDFKKIKIQKEYDRDLPLVPCEKSKIQQVFLNLLNNGAHAMHEAEIENPLIILRSNYEKTKNIITIEIEDNGPGMDENTRKRIFEPFFTTKGEGEGTGLGLSVSYFIITTNHNGEMIVESRSGEGAKFIIRLPVNSHRDNLN